MSRITQKGATGALAFQAGTGFQTSTDANLTTLVGTRYDLSDGREVMLVSVGTAAIGTAGGLVQDAAIVSNHQNLTVGEYVAASANGNVPASFNVTLGATKADVNQYQGGFAVVNAGAGIGQTLRITKNAQTAASGSCAIVLEDGANTALGVATKVCLIPPHGANVVINPTTPTGAPVGITISSLAAGIAAGATTGTPSFGFVTTKGLTSAFSDALVATVGQGISPSVTVTGATTVANGTAGVVVTTTIGYANQTAVSGEARSVFVNL